MRRLLVFISVIVFLLLFQNLIYKTSVYAQQTKNEVDFVVQPDPPTPTNDDREKARVDKPHSDNGFELPDSFVDETTKNVTITFTGLDDTTTYKLCTKGDPNDCSDGTSKQSQNGQLVVHVCGNHENDLKIPDNGTCGDKDYFWAQHTYHLTLLQDKSKIAIASFYVAHYYPAVHLETDKPPIVISIQGRRRPVDRGNRNNYKIELASKTDPSNVIAFTCATVKNDDPLLIQFNAANQGLAKKLKTGAYVIRVNEEVNEKGSPLTALKELTNGLTNPVALLGGLLVGPPVIVGFGLKDATGAFIDHCEAGFTYESVTFVLQKNRAGVLSINPKQILYDRDPSSTDIKGFEKAMPTSPPLPCALDSEGNPQYDLTTGNCNILNTAVGPIATDTVGFIKSLMTLLLSLSGGIALLIIIVSGYQLLISQGNPEKIQGARERITSAIVGLLFIIFSLVIMQLITKDILHLPGFS